MSHVMDFEDMPIKQELTEEAESEYQIKSEYNKTNPWLIENAENFLKYCCPECDYNSKDVQDFSKHVSVNHETSNKFYQNTIKIQQIKKSKGLEKSEQGKCVVPSCTTLNSFGFFKFPKQQEKHYAWLQLCGLELVQKDDRICADHFVNSDFCLKTNAYPSQNLHNGETQNEIMADTNGNLFYKFIGILGLKNN